VPANAREIPSQRTAAPDLLWSEYELEFIERFGVESLTLPFSSEALQR